MGEPDRDDLVTIIDADDSELDIPEIIPLLPVRDVVIFTDMLLPLFIGRERSIRAIEEAVTQDRLILLVTQKDPGLENPSPDDIFKVGTVGRVLRMLRLPDGRVKALVQGVSKAQIKDYVRRRGLYRVRIELVAEEPLTSVDLKTEALMRNVREQTEKIMAFRGELTGDVGSILEGVEDPGKLADLVASNLKLKVQDSQELIEITDAIERLRKINDLLSKELSLSAMQAKIQSDVKDEISKSQRDFFLREQMRAIHRELGEYDEKAKEIEEYDKKIKRARMS